MYVCDCLEVAVFVQFFKFDRNVLFFNILSYSTLLQAQSPEKEKKCVYTFQIVFKVFFF